MLTAYRQTLVGREEKGHKTINWDGITPPHTCKWPRKKLQCIRSKSKSWLHDAVMEWSFVNCFRGSLLLLELTCHQGCKHASSPSWSLVNSYVWCRIWVEHTFGFITPGKVNAIVSGWQGSLSLWESNWGAEGQWLQVPWQIMVSRWYGHLLVVSLGFRGRKLGICWEKAISMICLRLSLVSELQEGAD